MSFLGCFFAKTYEVVYGIDGDRDFPILRPLRASVYSNRAIGGVLCSFVGLIFTVIFRFAGNVQWNLRLLLLAGSALIALVLKVDVFWVVLIGLVVSVLLFT